MEIPKGDSIIEKLKQERYKYDFNTQAIDFWYNKIGVNVLPANPQQKFPNIGWKEWQGKPIPEVKINEWKNKKFFNGVIIVPGKVWRGDNKGKYLVHIDFDKKEAIDAFCTIVSKTTPLEKYAERFIVEVHKDNLSRIHLMFYSPIPFPRKTNDGIQVQK